MEPSSNFDLNLESTEIVSVKITAISTLIDEATFNTTPEGIALRLNKETGHSTSTLHACMNVFALICDS